jgi:hypothetical protein
MTSDEITSIRNQLTTAREHLRLIEERKAEYVLSVDIPLQLIKEEEKLRQRIDTLNQQIKRLPGSPASSEPPEQNAAWSDQDVDIRELRMRMTNAFNEEELALLCADIEQAFRADGINEPLDLEIVGGKSKATKVLNLIQFLDRRGRLGYIIQMVRASRPGLI